MTQSILGKRQRRELPVDEDTSAMRRVDDGDDSFVFGQSKKSKKNKRGTCPETEAPISHGASSQLTKKKKKSTRAVEHEAVADTDGVELISGDELEVNSKVTKTGKTKGNKAAAAKRDTMATKTNHRSTKAATQYTRSKQAARDTEGENAEESMPQSPTIAIVSSNDNCGRTRDRPVHQLGIEQSESHVLEALHKSSGRLSRKLRATDKNGANAGKSAEIIPDPEDAPQQHTIIAEEDDGQSDGLANPKPRRRNTVGRCRRFDSSAAVTATSEDRSSKAANAADGIVEKEISPDDLSPYDRQRVSRRRRPLVAVDANGGRPPPSPEKGFVAHVGKHSEETSQQQGQQQSGKVKRLAESPKTQSQQQTSRSDSPIQRRRPSKACAYKDRRSGEAQTHAHHHPELTRTTIARPACRATHQSYRRSLRRSQNNGSAMDAESSEPRSAKALLAYPAARPARSPPATRLPRHPRDRPPMPLEEGKSEAVEMKHSGCERAATNGDEDVDWLLGGPMPSPRRPVPPTRTAARSTSTKKHTNAPEMDLDDLIFNIASIASTHETAKSIRETARPITPPRSRRRK